MIRIWYSSQAPLAGGRRIGALVATAILVAGGIGSYVFKPKIDTRMRLLYCRWRYVHAAGPIERVAAIRTWASHAEQIGAPDRIFEVLGVRPVRSRNGISQVRCWWGGMGVDIDEFVWSDGVRCMVSPACYGSDRWLPEQPLFPEIRPRPTKRPISQGLARVEREVTVMCVDRSSGKPLDAFMIIAQAPNEAGPRYSIVEVGSGRIVVRLDGPVIFYVDADDYSVEVVRVDTESPSTLIVRMSAQGQGATKDGSPKS